MSSRSEIFRIKVRCLQDFHKQLLWNSNLSTFPCEICNTLNFFEHFLLGILKDVPPEHRVSQLSNYPLLDYFELYDVLLLLLHRLVSIHSEQEEAIIALLKCLSLALLFVDECTRIELPAIVSGLLYELKCSSEKIHKFFLQTLFRTIIPMCFGSIFDEEFMEKCHDDIPSIITVVLECVPDVSAHFQLIETLMLFKKNLWSDIMTVISFSDGSVKVNAVQLLFHYWPQLHPSTTMGHKLDMQCVYENISCENLQCKSAPKTNAAVTMLLDPGKSAYLSEKAPPLYLCHSCSQNTMTENSNVTFHDVLLPMEYIGYNCENKHCISTDPTATVTLCSSQCERRFVDGRSEGSLSNFQRNNFFWHILENKGIRYCEECYSNIHLILGDLVTQMSPSCAWNLSELESNVIVSTIISLLLEPASKVNPKLKTSKVRLFSDSDSTEQLNVTGSYPCLGCKVNIGLLIESQTLSHFGVWILITLCPPQQSTNQESATRLLAAVVAWYASNSRLESDELGNRLESLKQQYLESWLLEMSSIHFKAFLSVLLPHPSAECRATGHWDAIKPMWRHYQDALSLITCLSSYSIIRKEMWDCLIPAWMVALSSNLCPTELKQLKPVLNALLDVDLSPLPFDAEKVFEFVLKHFHSSQVWQHQQALSWLQIFCDVDVIIPLNIMLDAFNSADECLGFSMANDSVMNEKNLVLLFDTGGKLTDTEVETIFKQSRHSTITTVGSAFEDMNVSCSNKCSTDNEHTKQYSRVKISTHRQNANEQCNVISNRVSCYVEILEVVYHQMILQNQPKHGGVCNGEASKIIKLLNILLTHIVVKIENQPLQFSAEGGMKMDTFHQFFKFFMMILDYILPTGFPEWVGINGNCRWNVGSQRKDQTEQDDMCVNLENFQQFCFPVQLVFKLVKILHHLVKEADVFNHITHCISKLCLNGRVLQVISQISQPCIKQFERQLLFPMLWKQLQYTNRASHIVPVLMRGIIMSETAFFTIISLLSKSFSSVEGEQAEAGIDGWYKQFGAIHQIQALLMFTDITLVPFRSRLSHVIAYSACLILSMVDEPKGTKCTKAMFVLDALSIANLKVVCQSLQHEFDESVEDRMFVLSQLLLLNKLRPDCEALSCSFLSHCMDILAAESVIHRNLNKPFPFSSNACSQKSLLNDEELAVQIARARCNINNCITLKERISKIQSCAALDGGTMKSSFTLDDFPTRVAETNLQLDTESQKDDCVIETPIDCQTVHYLAHVICRHLTNDCQQSPIDYSARSYRTFFRQLQSMLGYNEQIGYFTNTPDVLRNTVGVYSLLTNLPMILDQNQTFGSVFLPMAVPMMQCILSSQASSGMVLNTDLLKLNILPCNVQQSWLKSLLIVMYKYPVSELSESKYIIPLILACLQALETEYHRCTSENSSLDVLTIGENLSSHASEKLEMQSHNFLSEPKHNWNNDICSKTKLDSGKENHKLVSNEQLLASKLPSSTMYSTGLNLGDDTDDDVRYDLCKDISTPLLEGGTEDIHVEKLLENSKQMSSNFPLSLRKCEASPNNSSGAVNLTSDIQDCHQSNSYIGSKTDLVEPMIAKSNGVEESNIEILMRCGRCSKVITELDEETLCLCIVNLCELIQFNAKPAVPLLPRVLKQLAVIAEPLLDDATGVSKNISTVSLVAKQAIRCIFHQLQKNAIFSCMFQVPFHSGDKFIPVVVACLKGYQNVHSVEVLEHALKGLPDDLTTISCEGMSCLLTNIAMYLRNLSPFSPSVYWNGILASFCIFFTKLFNYFSLCEMSTTDDVLEIMIHLLTIPVFVSIKQSLLEPFSKLLGIAIATCTFSLNNLYNLCSITNEMFNKDKDKLFFTRCVVTKLMASLKGNCHMSDQNVHLIIQLILLDGGSVCSLSHSQTKNLKFGMPCYAMECFHAHLSECLDILGDDSFSNYFNTDPVLCLSSSCGSQNTRKLLHSNDVKLSVAQIVAGELHNKSVHGLFPWLFNPPTTMQHGPKEYSECVTHVKKISWILLGALNHIVLIQNTQGAIWQPIPFEAGPNLASILQVILTGFLEQNKEQKFNMGSLFHAFLFCQIWTVYCEQLSYYLTLSNAMAGGSSPLTSCNVYYNPAGDHHACATQLLEFWSRVTPSILVLLEHEGKVTGNIHCHITSLIECLNKYKSTLLFKLYPMWSPMLNTLKPRQTEIPDMDTNSPPDCCTNTNLEGNNSKQLAKVVESIKMMLAKIETGEGLCVV